jgi:hypothetical protein
MNPVRTSQRLLLIFKCLNPGTYAQLCAELSLWKSVKQFLFAFLIIFAMLLVLFVPAVFFAAPKLASTMSSFTTFSLGGNFSADGPVVILGDPRVVINLRPNVSLSDENLLFSRQGIEWKRWYFFGTAERSWESLRDATKLSSGFYAHVLLFLAPSIAFWLGIFFLVKYLLLSLLFGGLAFLVPMVWRHRISFANALKIALFAATASMLFEMLLLPFVRLPLIWFGLFLALLFIGVVLVGERELSNEEPVAHHRKKKHDDG